jgi:hypothetical protein
LSTIGKLLRGSIDMHLHHGPDPRVERSVDALQVARQAQEAGMRAIVLKSHEHPTAPVAYILSQVVSDITIFGSICLDLEVGGLNIYALEASAKLGAKVVWMPTFTSANDMKINGRGDGGISVLDTNGKLLPVVDEILDIVKNYQMVLATGHISAPETFALVERAMKKGVSNIVITHPLWPRGGARLGLPEQQRMVEEGAFIEHCFANTMPFPDRLDPMRIVEAVRVVGAEHCIISTDFGQSYNPAPAEGMRMAIATMLKYGLSEREVELMVKVNPATLLGLS